MKVKDPQKSFFNVEMVYDRETLGTFVYRSVTAVSSIPTLYIRKAQFPKNVAPPKFIKVMVSA